MKKETPQSIEKTIFFILQMLLFYPKNLIYVPDFYLRSSLLSIFLQFLLWNFKLLILDLKISNSFLNFLIYLFIYLFIYLLTNVFTE